TYGGTIHLAETQSPEGMFNPLYSETTYDADIVDLVFEGLTYVDKNFQAQPALAQKWEVSEDYKTYTFFLDNRAEFHDGEPVTAEDVKYTYEMFLHPDYSGVRASNFTPILGAEEFQNGEADEVRGIKVIDDYTIEITLSKVHAPFLTVTTGFGILPEHILSEYDPVDMKKIDFNQNPIGSGPFEFVEYKTDEYTRLSAFENYRQGRPYLDNVVWRYVDEPALVIMLEKGEIDYAQIMASQFDRVKDMNNVTVHKQVRNGFGYLAFNLVGDSPVADQAVRQAVAYGVNRKGFQEMVMNGLAVNVNSPISQASWAYTDDLNQYPYNPEKAKEVLREAGWEMKDGLWHKNGEPLSFTINASSGSEFINQLVALAQDNLNEIGMDVEIRKLEFNTMTERVDNNELDVWFMGWSFGADPDPYNVWHTEGDWNRVGYGNEETDQLIEEARTTLDQYTRRQLYVEFQKEWNKSMPYLPMYANIYPQVLNKRVRGFDPNPIAMNPFGQGWELLKEVWIPKSMRK
ncbi:MAG TPA: ABC transporter substrate-binding protein, partial [Halanaerobiales bacterium]|nr:ABC transporter substrate-binding protein [Halanaerobiales bacterium]